MRTQVLIRHAAHIANSAMYAPPATLMQEVEAGLRLMLGL